MLWNRVEASWLTAGTRDWSSSGIGGTFPPRLHPQIAAAQTLAPNYVMAEVETQRPSL